MSKKKITVVVNKAWEYEPFFNAITNSVLRAEGLPDPTDVVVPPSDEVMIEPRAKMSLPNIDVVFRCVQNMMDPKVNKSNSEEKMKYMPEILSKDDSDLVISVSTAESTLELESGYGSINGSVIVGTKYFMSDQRTKDPQSESRLDVKGFQMQEYPDNLNLFERICTNGDNIVKRFIPQNNARAEQMYFVASQEYWSVGVVNIMNYEAYEEGDPAAYAECRDKIPANDYCATIETTHGIVSMAVNKDRMGGLIPVYFVSPITDRYTKFAVDVDAAGIQNYIAGFNAGIAVGEMLLMLNDIFS